MQLQQFNFTDSQSIRAIEKDNEPWFVAKDVCEILDYSNTSKAISDHVDEDDRYNESLDRGGNLILINESGLYSLIFGSRKPEAKLFKKWVTSEVLPAIRKTGSYSRPKTQIEIILAQAQALVDIERKQQQQESRLTELENRVQKKYPDDFGDQFVTPTQIGAMFEPVKSGKAVNKLLKDFNLQWKVDGQWVPKDQGKKYSSYDYIQLDNGKTIPQLLWQRRVKDLLV